MLDIKEVLNYARLSTAEAGSSPAEATLITVQPLPCLSTTSSLALHEDARAVPSQSFQCKFANVVRKALQIKLNLAIQ